MEYSSSGSRPCEQLFLSRRLSKFFKMNWTEGTLYRHSRGRLRKANAEKQRQKGYFARAHIRAAEQREVMKNGPPPISYLQSSSALPETPTDAIPPKQNSAHGASHRGGRWGASVPTAEDTTKSEHLLPTVDEFLKEQLGKDTSTNTAPSQLLPKGTQVERLRQRLLASKDWGASRIRSPVQVHNQPRPMPEHVGPTQPTKATKEKPAHILQSNQDLYPQKHTSHLRFFGGADVQIRVGSQEKQLESSTVGRGSLAHPKQNAPTKKGRRFVASASDCESRDMPPHKRVRRQPASNAEVSSSTQVASQDTDSDDTRHFVTSVPNIFHPVPLRAIPSHLLLSSGSLDSANTASHLAQVGRTISPVSLSQEAGNTIWKAWLEDSSSASGAQTNPEPHEPVAQPRISPGVSERQVRHQGPSPPAQALRTGENDIPLPELRLSSSGTHTNELGQYDRPVAKMGHSTSALSRGRLSVLLETSSNGADKKVENANWHESAASNQPVTTQCEPTRGLHRGDHIDAWKTFVFGDDDSEEIEREAFSKARHDAARHIRPYDENSLPSIGDGDHSGHDNNIAMAGTSSSGNAEGSKPYERDFATGNPNQSAKKVHEPASTDSQPTSTSAEEHLVVHRYTPFAHSHDSVAVVPPCVDTSPISNKSETADNITISMSDASGESTSVAISVTTCTGASLAVEPAQSRLGSPESGARFRFAVPKPFVGKHSVPSRNDGPSAAIASVSLKRKRGRPRKRARDGRADIRALPNYSGDPIEEVEDNDDAPPSFLFGSLDVCYDQ